MGDRLRAGKPPQYFTKPPPAGQLNLLPSEGREMSRATPCVEVWQTSNQRRQELGEEKRKKERKKQQGKNIMVCPIP